MELREEALYELGYLKRRVERTPEEIEQAARKAEKRAKEKRAKMSHVMRGRIGARLRELHPRPERCPECGGGGRLHLHHDPPSWSELWRTGKAEDLSAHNVRWLCRECHAAAHAGESIAPLIAASMI